MRTGATGATGAKGATYVATDTEPYNDHARIMLAARNDDGFKLLYENHAAEAEA